MNPNYSIRQLDGKFYIYANDLVLETPGGHKVSTSNEQFSSLLLEALRNNEDYTDSASVLCYHYSFLDTKDKEDVYRQQVKELTYNTFFTDEFTLLGQLAPVKSAFAEYYFETVPEFLASLPRHKLMAILNLWSATDSLILPYRIVEKVIQEGMSEKDFLDELTAFLCEQHESREAAQEATDELVPSFRAFIKYYSLDSV